MLTKNDLYQIGGLLDKKLDQKIDEKFGQLDQNIDKKLDQKFKKELKPIRLQLKKIQSDIRHMIVFFDRDYDNLRKRVDRVEHHLRLPPL